MLALQVLAVCCLSGTAVMHITTGGMHAASRTQQALAAAYHLLMLSQLFLLSEQHAHTFLSAPVLCCHCCRCSLQACITAAVQLIQARNPSYSPARCWHMLFARYCEVWQQQHALLGLWASNGGWMGAVRAGGLLTVLRGVTPAEALAQESTPSALKQVITVGAGCFCDGAF